MAVLVLYACVNHYGSARYSPLQTLNEREVDEKNYAVMKQTMQTIHRRPGKQLHCAFEMPQPDLLNLQRLLRDGEFLAFAAADADTDDLTCGSGDALTAVLEFGYAFVVFNSDGFELLAEFSI